MLRVLPGVDGCGGGVGLVRLRSCLRGDGAWFSGWLFLVVGLWFVISIVCFVVVLFVVWLLFWWLDFFSQFCDGCLFGWLLWGWDFLCMDEGWLPCLVVGFCLVFMESLILAQDERWRRA